MFLKILLPLLILSCSLVTAFSGEDINEVYNAWAPQGGNFTIGQNVFYVQSGAADGLRVALTKGSDTVIIINSSCEEYDKYFLCYEGTKFFEYNEEVDKAVDQFKIVVKKRIPNIQFTKREIDNENPYQWEEITITTRFENQGILDINQINFTESFPKAFFVTKASTCSHNSTHVWWAGRLNQGVTILCTYSIQPLNVTSYSTKGTIEYYDDQPSLISSSTLTINVDEPKITLNSSLSKHTNVRLGEEIELYLFINNTEEDSSATISKFEVTVPNGVKVVESSRNFVQDGNVFRYSGKIIAGRSTELALTLYPEKTGKLSIDEYLLYFIGNKRIEIPIKETFMVEVDNVTASISLEEGNATGGKPNRVKILAVNNGKADQFHNLVATITSDTLNWTKVVELERISTKNHQVLFDGDIQFPNVEEEIDIPFNITITYKTKYGQQYTKRYSTSLHTVPYVEQEHINQTPLQEGTESSGVIQEETSTLVGPDTLKSGWVIWVLAFVGGFAVMAGLIMVTRKIISRRKGDEIKQLLMKENASKSSQSLMDTIREVKKEQEEENLPPSEIQEEPEQESETGEEEIIPQEDTPEQTKKESKTEKKTKKKTSKTKKSKKQKSFRF